MSDVEEIAHAIAGAGGGALSMIVTYPLVTLSTLAQTASTRNKKESKTESTKESEVGTGAVESSTSSGRGSLSLTTQEKILAAIKNSITVKVTQEILQTKGFLGLYSGLESALYGITLTNFIYYYFYEWVSNIFLKSNKTSGRSRGLSTMQSIITGAIAGAITCVGSNPFWVANTRMMTQKKDGKSSSAFKTIVDIIQNDGVATLFAGVLPALVLVINPIIQYTIFEQIKNVIIAKNGVKSFTASKAFFIGAFGKLIATTLTYPYITLKARMHVAKKAKGDEEKNLSMIQQIRNIIAKEGLEGLYGGLSIKLIQSISTAAFLFYFKEELMSGSVKLVEIFRMLSLKKKN